MKKAIVIAVMAQIFAAFFWVLVGYCWAEGQEVYAAWFACMALCWTLLDYSIKINSHKQ